MQNLPIVKLNTEEYRALQELVTNATVMIALRKVFGTEEIVRLESMRSEALGLAKVGEIVRYAAESRVFAEWENILKKRMELLAPQSR